MTLTTAKIRKAVEIRESRGLLVAQVLQGLQGHLLRGDRITCLLEVGRAGPVRDRNLRRGSGDRDTRRVAGREIARGVP